MRSAGRRVKTKAGEPYCETGVKLLMVAVLETAMVDYRQRMPKQPYKPCRRWTSARSLLEGKSRGPGGMTMLEFFFSVLDLDEGIIERGVLLEGGLSKFKRRYSSPTARRARTGVCAHHKTLG